MKTESEIRAEIERKRSWVAAAEAENDTWSAKCLAHAAQALEWTLTPSASPQTDKELVEAMARAALAKGNEIVPFAHTWEMADEDERKHVCQQIRAALSVAREQIERKALKDAAKAALAHKPANDGRLAYQAAVDAIKDRSHEP